MFWSACHLIQNPLSSTHCWIFSSTSTEQKSITFDEQAIIHRIMPYFILFELTQQQNQWAAPSRDDVCVDGTCRVAVRSDLGTLRGDAPGKHTESNEITHSMRWQYSCMFLNNSIGRSCHPPPLRSYHWWAGNYSPHHAIFYFIWIDATTESMSCSLARRCVCRWHVPSSCKKRPGNPSGGCARKAHRVKRDHAFDALAVFMHVLKQFNWA